MEKTFFISGIGGQGVQVLCKALATVVDECGMNMCLFPWYQGQRRGGATFGRLIISDERVGAPEKRHYDVCVYLDPASLRDYAERNEQQAELYGRAFDMGVELAESDSRN